MKNLMEFVLSVGSSSGGAGASATEGVVERSEIEQHSIKKSDRIDLDLVGACIVSAEVC